MKRFSTLLMAIFAMVSPQQLCASTLAVTYNSDSDVYTGLLNDGTVLGFDISGSSAYFYGAISSASSITVPDSISITDTIYQDEYYYPVKYCGLYSEYLDLEDATNVTSLTLPKTITYIYDVPSQITDLHLLSTSVPTLSETYSISNTTTVWVPQSAYNTYINATTNSYNNWYGLLVHYEGWMPTIVTINETTAGTFANLLLDQVSQWTDVDELIVIGHMNETDMTYLSRLDNVIKIDLSQTDITTINGCADLIFLKTVILPSTVTDVQDKAFKGCIALSSISIPNATQIGSSAFYGCSNLSTISLPQATIIDKDAFYNCESLLSISLPNVLLIDENAFSYCYSLQSISLPKVYVIEHGAFYYCKELNDVSLSDVYQIGDNAFYNCKSLSAISLPNAAIIDDYAFYNCSSLSSILLSPYLQGIADNAFKGTALQHVYCYAVAPISTSAFPSSYVSNATLYVPEISRKSYMTHDDWSNFTQTLTLDYNASILAINGDFTLNSTNGVDDQPNMIVYDQGHVTIETESDLSLSLYKQWLSTDPTYNSNTRTYTYPYTSTLITQNNITADDVEELLYVYNDRWYFISFPYDVDVNDIYSQYEAQWVIRKYSGLNRANLNGDTWQDVGEGATLYAGEGYIFSTDQSELWFVFPAKDNSTKNNIFAHTDVEVPLQKYASTYAHNRNWNLVGNPYPCYYNTTAISHNGVITVWNGNGYTAYSLLDDEYYLRPNEAFFVQCPEDATSMTFAASGRSHTYVDNADHSNDYYYAPSRNGETNRWVCNLTLSDNQFTDKARLVINENASLDYELSCDASKFMSSNTSIPQLYILEDKERLSIDERPLANGVIKLGVYGGEDGNYTIALSSNQGNDCTVLLVDNLTGKSTNLGQSAYTFSMKKGNSDDRFSIVLKNDILNELQEIKNGTASSDVEVYRIDGSYVGRFDSETDLKKMPMGTYIVRSSESVHKCVIK